MTIIEIDIIILNNFNRYLVIWGISIVWWPHYLKYISITPITLVCCLCTIFHSNERCFWPHNSCFWAENAIAMHHFPLLLLCTTKIEEYNLLKSDCEKWITEQHRIACFKRLKNNNILHYHKGLSNDESAFFSGSDLSSCR